MPPVDFAACGDMAASNDNVRLHYGREQGLNDCIMTTFSQGDRALWSAVYKNLPDWIHKVAQGCDANAAKLDGLFRAKLAEKAPEPGGRTPSIPPELQN